MYPVTPAKNARERVIGVLLVLAGIGLIVLLAGLAAHTARDITGPTTPPACRTETR